MSKQSIRVDYEKLRCELASEADGYGRLRAWTREEDGLLRDFYGRVPAWRLAERLGRAKHQVHYRAERLGLTRGRGGGSDGQGGS